MRYQVIPNGTLPLDICFDTAKAGEKYEIDIQIRYPDGVVRSEKMAVEIVEPKKREPKKVNGVKVRKRK